MPTIGTSWIPSSSSTALHRVELPLAAVDQHADRAIRPLAIGILLQRAREAALQHLAHHREIVARRGIGRLMLNLRYWLLRNPSGPATTIAPSAVGALDMAVVVDFDRGPAARPARTARPPRAAACACVVDSASRRSSASLGVALRLLEQLPLVAALRHRQRDLAPRALAQRLAQQLAPRAARDRAGSVAGGGTSS